MEGCLKRNFGIMEAVGVKFDFGSCGATTEEVDRSPFANHVHSPLPRLGPSYGFDGHVSSASIGPGKNSIDRILRLERLHDIVSSKLASGGGLLISLYHCNHVHAAHFCHLHEHKANWSAADDYYRVADLRASFMQSAQHTGQRLSD